jgi:hypothetical protein
MSDTTAALAPVTTADAPNAVDDAADDLWARPRPMASRRATFATALLAVAAVGLAAFALGVNYGKSHATSTGVGGRVGPGQFGAAPVGATSGTGPTGSTTTTTTTIDPSLGGLLPGLESGAPPASAQPSAPPTTAP